MPRLLGGKSKRQAKALESQKKAEAILGAFNELFDEDDMQGDEDVLTVGPYKTAEEMPQVRVMHGVKRGQAFGSYVEGPPADDSIVTNNIEDVLCGRTVTTYPPGMGVPICDVFFSGVIGDVTVIAVADGCGWGHKAREAARKAIEVLREHLSANLHAVTTAGEASDMLRECFMQIHSRIIAGFDENVWDAGTTTLFAGVILPVDMDDDCSLGEMRRMASGLNNYYRVPMAEFEADDNLKKTLFHAVGGGAPWPDADGEEFRAEFDAPPAGDDDEEPPPWRIFVGMNVGDTKAYHFSPLSCCMTDITEGNRTNLTDAADPGGRLGPTIQPNGDPDLRNLASYVMPCLDEDFIFVCSDGVHDNLDPQNFGITPNRLGMGYAAWEEAEAEDVDGVIMSKTDFSMQLLRRIVERGGKFDIYDSVLPDFVATLTDFAIAVTEPSRVFMRESPGKRLPSDYSRFPGKMDHTTLVGCLVSAAPFLNDTPPVPAKATSPVPAPSQPSHYADVGNAASISAKAAAPVQSSHYADVGSVASISAKAAAPVQSSHYADVGSVASISAKAAAPVQSSHYADVGSVASLQPAATKPKAVQQQSHYADVGLSTGPKPATAKQTSHYADVSGPQRAAPQGMSHYSDVSNVGNSGGGPRPQPAGGSHYHDLAGPAAGGGGLASGMLAQASHYSDVSSAKAESGTAAKSGTSHYADIDKKGAKAAAPQPVVRGRSTFHCYDPSYKHLADVPVSSIDTVAHLICAVREALVTFIGCRPFRLRRAKAIGDLKTEPVRKKDFSLPAYEVFHPPDFILVIQLGETK